MIGEVRWKFGTELKQNKIRIGVNCETVHICLTMYYLSLNSLYCMKFPNLCNGNVITQKLSNQAEILHGFVLVLVLIVLDKAWSHLGALKKANNKCYTDTFWPRK